MNCPNCAAEMTPIQLDGHLRVPVAIDMCVACQAFWFDRYESLKLSAGSTLKLMRSIGEHPSGAGAPFSDNLRCPRCSVRLSAVNDMQRNTRFSYWRCHAEHGRFIRFFEFLREKDFIRPLSPHQIEELRKNLQSVNCSNCGAPVDLATGAACVHCGTPLSLLDMKRPQEMIARLKQSAEIRPVSASLPLELARARREVEMSFPSFDPDSAWWNEASGTGLVQAGLNAFAKWLAKSGV